MNSFVANAAPTEAVDRANGKASGRLLQSYGDLRCLAFGCN